MLSLLLVFLLFFVVSRQIVSWILLCCKCTIRRGRNYSKKQASVWSFARFLYQCYLFFTSAFSLPSTGKEQAQKTTQMPVSLSSYALLYIYIYTYICIYIYIYIYIYISKLKEGISKNNSRFCGD